MEGKRGCSTALMGTGIYPLGPGKALPRSPSCWRGVCCHPRTSVPCLPPGFSVLSAPSLWIAQKNEVLGNLDFGLSIFPIPTSYTAALQGTNDFN